MKGFSILTLLSALFLTASARGQEVMSNGDSASRLEQAETTYQANLGKLHTPVIQEYLTALEALKKTYRRPEDVSEIENEIKKIRQLASTTGVMPYTAFESPRRPVDDPKEKQRDPTLALPVAEAVTPAPTSAEPRTSLPLGTIIWQISQLPAGNYDVMMVYSAAELILAEPLLLTLGTNQIETSLPTDRATGSDQNYRIFKIGSISTDEALVSTTLTLQSGNPNNPQINLRNVLFVKAKPEG